MYTSTVPFHLLRFLQPTPSQSSRDYPSTTSLPFTCTCPCTFPPCCTSTCQCIHHVSSLPDRYIASIPPFISLFMFLSLRHFVPLHPSSTTTTTRRRTLLHHHSTTFWTLLLAASLLPHFTYSTSILPRPFA